MEKKYPAYILCSTDRIDSTDPFQYRWLLRQTLLHGRAEDIRDLYFILQQEPLDRLEYLFPWPGRAQAQR